jgi:hypothetical protein
VWRFFVQEVPDLATELQVPELIHELGFNWADVLPRKVYELFQNEVDARDFFKCLFAEGRVPILRTQEMLRAKVLVPARPRPEIIVDRTPIDSVRRLPGAVADPNGIEVEETDPNVGLLWRL